MQHPGTEIITKLRSNPDLKGLIGLARYALLGELLTALAHEINNPLAVAQGHSHLIVQMGAGEREMDLDRLQKSGVKIGQSTETIASLTRRTRALVDDPESPATQSLLDSIKEAQALTDAKLGKRQINVEISDIDSSVRVTTKPNALCRISIALLLQGMSAVNTLSPDIERSVTLTTQLLDGRLVLDQVDTAWKSETSQESSIELQQNSIIGQLLCEEEGLEWVSGTQGKNPFRSQIFFQIL